MVGIISVNFTFSKCAACGPIGKGRRPVIIYAESLMQFPMMLDFHTISSEDENSLSRCQVGLSKRFYLRPLKIILPIPERAERPFRLQLYTL